MGKMKKSAQWGKAANQYNGGKEKISTMGKGRNLLLLLKCDTAALCYQDVCLRQKHTSEYLWQLWFFIVSIVILDCDNCDSCLSQLWLKIVVIVTSARIRSAVWRLWSALCRWSRFELSHSEWLGIIVRMRMMIIIWTSYRVVFLTGPPLKVPSTKKLI